MEGFLDGIAATLKSGPSVCLRLLQAGFDREVFLDFVVEVQERVSVHKPSHMFMVNA